MNTKKANLVVDRLCLREPIPEITDAVRHLDAAVSAHLAGQHDLAESLICLADMPVIREWTKSLWGTASPHIQYRVVAGAPPGLPHDQRIKVRMPTTAEKQRLHQRDGYHCRFCGIPVIRAEVRQAIKEGLSRCVAVEKQEPRTARRFPNHVASIRPPATAR